jgi:opacity protein-like surface antigen
VNDDRYNFNGQSTATTCLVFDPMSGCKTFNTPSSVAVDFSAPSANRFGWTIGLGTEWAVFDHWSVFGEWDYMNFGTHTVTLTDAFFGSTQFSAKQQVNVLKLGINYRFGNSLPEH